MTKIIILINQKDITDVQAEILKNALISKNITTSIFRFDSFAKSIASQSINITSEIFDKSIGKHLVIKSDYSTLGYQYYWFNIKRIITNVLGKGVYASALLKKLKTTKENVIIVPDFEHKAEFDVLDDAQTYKIISVGLAPPLVFHKYDYKANDVGIKPVIEKIVKEVEEVVINL
jgi:hypothetical protein